MNTFYFAYEGNKRQEYKIIKDYIPKSDTLKYFIEPFAGSASISYLYSLDNPNAQIKYIINDINKNLIKFYSNIQKEQLPKIINYINKNLNSNAFEKIKAKEKQNIKDWVYLNKIFIMHKGVNPFKYKHRKISPIDISKYNDRINFDKKIQLSSFDFTTILNKYKNNTHAFIFLDPPYLESSNTTYTNYGKNINDSNEIIDNTEMYIIIKDFLETAKCKVMLVINSNAIIKYIFNGFIKYEYDKTYSASKKKTKHLIITNYKIEK